MNRQSIYSIICLVSLMFFFTNSLLFIGNLFFDNIVEQHIEQSDLLEGETENESESKTPTEEEQEHTPFVIPVFQDINENITLYTIYSDFWDNVSISIPTEPPEKAV